ncbi:MAG: citrate synthase, partial [Clostridiaceae bacterium]|nr:citrate synthase [Clostridiaceae bacterium]
MENGKAVELETKMLENLSDISQKRSRINPDLYSKYEVKRGLRDLDGKGVLVGLTDICEVHAYIIDENETIPAPGRLLYRGIDIVDIVNGFISSDRPGYEETCYLLLFGELPDKSNLANFTKLLSIYRKLPEDFVRDMILKSPSKDMMNVLSRGVLCLYSMDDRPDDTSVSNVLKQCLKLISCFPLLAVYGYQAYSHYHENKSLYIHSPRP